jgi:hypothetical protein
MKSLVEHDKFNLLIMVVSILVLSIAAGVFCLNSRVGQAMLPEE